MILPDFVFRCLHNALNSVLLPDPFGPIITLIFPSLIIKDSLSMIFFLLYPNFYLINFNAHNLSKFLCFIINIMKNIPPKTLIIIPTGI